jgi:SAM-dependent methyltransferase
VAPSATTDLYDAIAPIYDEWHAWNGMTPFARVAAAKLAQILDGEAAAVAQTGRGRPALLDAGCGTGTLLLDVARAHPSWRLAGADASAGMLAVARAKAMGVADVVWARAELEALPFGTAFDVCSVFYDTVNHLLDAPALLRAFAAAAAVLRPGGLLVFDVTNRLGFEQWWDARNLFSGTDWRVWMDARFDSARGVGVADVTLKRGRVKGRFQIRERHFDRNEINAALLATGFTPEQEHAWSPFPVGGPGKTWWAARLR